MISHSEARQAAAPASTIASHCDAASLTGGMPVPPRYPAATRVAQATAMASMGPNNSTKARKHNTKKHEDTKENDKTRHPNTNHTILRRRRSPRLDRPQPR